MAHTRRGFLATAAAGGALALGARRTNAQAGGEVVLAGAHVVTMDPGLGDLATGDVHIRDGAIAAVAASIAAPGVPRRDMRGRVVMPGFVDTHWHMWNTIARGLPSSRLGPFAKTMGALAKVWTPQASALSVRLALAEAVNSGITTAQNWAHNTATPDFAEAELAAQRASGVRGRFAYGYPQALSPDTTIDVAALKRFAERHGGAGGLVLLGMCARGPDRSADDVWRGEWRAARELKLPITAHVASNRASAAEGAIAVMHRDGLLGPDVQIVHATHARPEDFALMKEAGSPLSISPWTELEVGYGLPAIPAMAASGVEMGLSVDNMVLAGRADMFDVMRLTADLAAGMAEKQSALPDRRVLEWATIGGARGLGLGDAVGSLKPGKRADVIAVRADGLTTSPAGTVDFLLTHAAQPADVDFVMIDGVVHKEGGRLTRVDVEALVAEAAATIARLTEQAGVR
ncbi:amidohydrolase family protein [Chenggangzhangella methanolivorans]|uniref:Amidohydrolase family protein n=1 Tax=Chenggangzhangella methanolivorans TaxID=1437009 RepID=A0A9E6UG07_9HYPH|nr:amidohydrolase family protein [Chenggangzhangella methanolivorans]QZN98262.1 amidohydrolase family protein [Chenggangzhangella methanolivorans]